MDENELLQSSLNSAITKTLEAMTFHAVEIDDETNIGDARMSDHFWARQQIQRPLSGELVLETSSISAKQLAHDIYGGSQTEFSDKTIRDVLAEVLNTIAGSFIKELAASDKAFEIGLPITGVGTKQQAETPITGVRAKVGSYFLTAFISGEDFLESNFK